MPVESSCRLQSIVFEIRQYLNQSLAPSCFNVFMRTDPSRHAGSTKKSQIIDLFQSGARDIRDIADRVGSSTSYVASVLQNEGLLFGYFDLYTGTAAPMNVYSKEFSGRLGFKNEDRARRSVELLNQFYSRAQDDKDRAGQHHALLMGLTLFDRARWSGKSREAEIFRDWLIDKLREDGVTEPSTM